MYYVDSCLRLRERATKPPVETREVVRRQSSPACMVARGSGAPSSLTPIQCKAPMLGRCVHGNVPHWAQVGRSLGMQRRVSSCVQ